MEGDKLDALAHGIFRQSRLHKYLQIVREHCTAGPNHALNYRTLMNLFAVRHIASLKIYEIFVSV
jgi:hypothetical protein